MIKNIVKNAVLLLRCFEDTMKLNKIEKQRIHCPEVCLIMVVSRMIPLTNSDSVFIQCAYFLMLFILVSEFVEFSSLPEQY